jgi:hypothetical protein
VLTRSARRMQCEPGSADRDAERDRHVWSTRICSAHCGIYAGVVVAVLFGGERVGTLGVRRDADGNRACGPTDGTRSPELSPVHGEVKMMKGLGATVAPWGGRWGRTEHSGSVMTGDQTGAG